MSEFEGETPSKKRRLNEGSDVAYYPNSLTEAQNSSSDVLTSQHNVSDTAHIICSDQRLTHYKRPEVNQDQLLTKNVPEVDLMTSSGVDNNVLVNVLESTDLDRANNILKGGHPISQNELTRALISACRHGNIFLVQKCIGLGANVEVKDTNGKTPLLICAENGFFDIVCFLLWRKADVNAFNSEGDTALILSIRESGSSQMVKVLLAQRGIDITHQNRDGYTALMRAIEVKDVNTIKLLMDKYRDKNIAFNESVNCKGETTEQIAERCGLGNVVRILYRSNRVMSPLAVAFQICDIESFDLLLDCHFEDEMDMETSVYMAFRKIFATFRLRQDEVNGDDKFVMLRRLLDCGAKFYMFHNNDLVFAVETGNYKLVEFLCQQKNLQQKNDIFTGCTEALKAAARSGRCDIVDILLQYQKAVNKNNYSDSPLDNALRHRHIECAQLLVQHGARMDIEQALVAAANQEEPDYMNFLFDNYKPDILNYGVNKADQFNKLLLSAARMGNVEIIKHLLDAGADINHDSFYKKTPLSESKNGEVAKFLISRGAKVNHVTLGSNTPLLNFVLDYYYYNMDVINELLENGASVNGRCSYGRTPLIIAVSKSESVVALKTLLDHGANFNDQDVHGNTALIEAAKIGCPESMSFLLHFAKEKKHSVNVQDTDGRTALMHAVHDVNRMKLLVECGADVSMKDCEGNTALMHALTQRPSEEILTFLITAGSDVNCQNNDGFSPLMVAAEYARELSIKILLDAGADVNAVSKKDNTKTALTVLTDALHGVPYTTRISTCLHIMLERGADSSYVVDPRCLQNIILEGGIEVIPKLIRNGQGPRYTKTKSLDYFGIQTTRVSPLCVALMVGNVSLAHFFMENLFLTNSDVSKPDLASDKNFRSFLEKWKDKKSLHFLDKLSSQPMSLFQLAFVTVTSAIGASPGREERVNMLPVTEAMKDKLLFRSGNVSLGVPSGHKALVSTVKGRRRYEAIQEVLRFNWRPRHDYAFYLSDIY